MNTLGIFVKQPQAGQVKTRLGAQLGYERAANIYAAFLGDITERFLGAGDERYLCYAPRDGAGYFESLGGKDYRLWSQPELGLGERMEGFFQERLTVADERVVIIGSDSPTLPAEYVERAFELLDDADCVLGPTADGGYYLVGMRGRPLPIFEGISWSTSSVLDETVTRIADLKADLALLPPWYDVDTPEDLRMLRGHVRALRQAQSPLNLDAVSRVLDADIGN